MQFKQLCLSLYVAMIVMTTVAFICRKIIGVSVCQVKPSNCFRRLEK